MTRPTSPSGTDPTDDTGDTEHDGPAGNGTTAGSGTPTGDPTPTGGGAPQDADTRASDGGGGDGAPPGAGAQGGAARPAGRQAGGPRVALVAVLVAIGCLALAAVVLVHVGADEDDASAGDGGDWHGTLLGEARPRPDFTLTDTEGRPYDFQAETGGRLTLLFFGYTSCPDVCPIHMATLGAALREGGMPDPIVVFVSTDPDRDTPERIREWLDGFSPDFVGLRGTPEEVRTAEMAAQVPPSMRGTGEGDDYEVGHAAQVLSYTPDDLSHVVYPFGVRREDWLADLPRLSDAWPAS